MNLEKSLNEIFKFSLIDFLKNNKLKKYFLCLLILLLFYFITYILIVGSVGSIIKGNAITLELYIQIIFILFIWITIISIPFGVIQTFFEYKIFSEILRTKKIKVEKLNIIKFIKFLVFPIILFLYALFSVFKIKFLFIGIFSIILIIIGVLSSTMINNILGIIFVALGLIIGIIYFCIVIYELLRLGVSQVAFIEEKGIKSALKKSWQLTENNIINLIVILIVFFVIIYVISMVFMIPLILYSTSLPLATTLEQELITLFNPIYNLLMLPIYLASAYLILIQTCVMANVYTILKEDNETKEIKQKKSINNK